MQWEYCIEYTSYVYYIHSMEHKRPALRPFNAFRAIDMPVKDKISHADKVTQRGVR